MKELFYIFLGVLALGGINALIYVTTGRDYFEATGNVLLGLFVLSLIYNWVTT